MLLYSEKGHVIDLRNTNDSSRNYNYTVFDGNKLPYAHKSIQTNFTRNDLIKTPRNLLEKMYKIEPDATKWHALNDDSNLSVYHDTKITDPEHKNLFINHLLEPDTDADDLDITIHNDNNDLKRYVTGIDSDTSYISPKSNYINSNRILELNEEDTNKPTKLISFTSKSNKDINIKNHNILKDKESVIKLLTNNYKNTLKFDLSENVKDLKPVTYDKDSESLVKNYNRETNKAFTNKNMPSAFISYDSLRTAKSDYKEAYYKGSNKQHNREMNIFTHYLQRNIYQPNTIKTAIEPKKYAIIQYNK